MFAYILFTLPSNSYTLDCTPTLSHLHAFNSHSHTDTFTPCTCTSGSTPSKVYDRSLQRQENAPPHSLGTTPSDDNDEDLGFDFVINFLGLMGEYGGAMNASLTVAAAQVRTEGICFQKISLYVSLEFTSSRYCSM